MIFCNQRAVSEKSKRSFSNEKMSLRRVWERFLSLRTSFGEDPEKFFQEKRGLGEISDEFEETKPLFRSSPS